MTAMTRECGCEWEIIPVAGQSERVRQTSFDNPVARFTQRCADHEPMCRALEPWELHLFAVLSANEAEETA